MLRWIDTFSSDYKYDFPVRVFLISLILIPSLYPLTWINNEFAYFGLAKQQLDPAPNSALYAVNNNQFSRFLTDYTIGYFVKFLGYDQGWVVLRFLVIFALSCSYAFLTRALRISIAPALLALYVFKRYFGQTYFAGEWIIGGVEAKTFAYPLVFLGLGYTFARNLSRAALCFGLASYFHFLVGGFWGNAAFAYAYFWEDKNRRVFRFWLYYVLSFLPVIFMIWLENYKLPAPDLSGFEHTLNQIYSNIRHPHHTAPFALGSLSPDWRNGLPPLFINGGILYAGSRLKLFQHNLIARWLFSLHLYLLLALMLAYLDREAQHFGKFYLFRPASLTLLLTLILFFELAVRKLNAFSKTPIVLAAILALLTFGPLVKKLPEIKQNFGLTLYGALPPDEKKLIDWIKSNTDPANVVLVEEGGGKQLKIENFEQIVERPTLVTWKFVPITNYDLARWYRLIQLKKKAFAGECGAFGELRADYAVTLSEKAFERIGACGRVLYSEQPYNVIMLAKSPH